MKSDLRRLVRGFIPRGLYQGLSNLAGAIAVIRSEGLGVYRTLSSRDGNEITLQLKSLRHPFRLRCNDSHVGGLIQNVLRGEYDAHLACSDPAVIVDAGAFIGDLTCHWATLYPNARIISLEPNPENFSFALQNTAPYAPKVALLGKGLWSHPGKLSVAGSEMGSHLVEEGERDSAEVDVVDIPTLMGDLSLSSIDILKLDIEGAERQVLNPESATWLPRVKQVIVEMHGQDIEDEIVPHMLRQGFEARRYRSLIFFSRPPEGAA